VNKVRTRTVFVSLGFVILLFLGAMFWAQGRDPYRRIWFKVKAARGDEPRCVAVLPKAIPSVLDPEFRGKFAVVLYLHGAGGMLLRSGNELRQIAELGLAAVGMEYCQTNNEKCETEIGVLLDWLSRQSWADTDRTAWVGYSLGAQRLLAYTLKHPERQPKLLVRLNGGWVPEVGSKGLTFSAHLGEPTVHGSILLIHSEKDQVFPLSEAQQLAAYLRSRGTMTELRVLAGLDHGLGNDRLVVFRTIGEYCLTHLNGSGALRSYSSILLWQIRAKPLWVHWLPALAWMSLMIVIRWQSALRSRNPETQGVELRSDSLFSKSLKTLVRYSGDLFLRWMTCILAVAAFVQTAVHLIAPRLPVNDLMLGIARRYFVQAKQRNDFEFLARDSVWQCKRLKLLLEHVELSGYNREIIKWRVENELYRDFVLSPRIDAVLDGDLTWRRPLWEHFYPRIRKEQTPEAAARIVARHLRERVTIAKGEDWLPNQISGIWLQQITNSQGFECIYVAALRSVGIAARLSGQAKAQFWTGSEWKPAPRPAVESLGLFGEHDSAI
jgi:dienelactone hydrolase